MRPRKCFLVYGSNESDLADFRFAVETSIHCRLTVCLSPAEFELEVQDNYRQYALCILFHDNDDELIASLSRSFEWRAYRVSLLIISKKRELSNSHSAPHFYYLGQGRRELFNLIKEISILPRGPRRQAKAIKAQEVAA